MRISIPPLSTFRTQQDAPWGLVRISHLSSYHQTGYDYLDWGTPDGQVFVLDSGIYRAHHDFEGRVQFGARFPSPFLPLDLVYGDPNGHGTHVAGIVGSRTYGVSKTSRIIDVVVCDARGFCDSDDVIAGIQFAIDNVPSHRPRHPGVVINLSLGFVNAQNDAWQDVEDAIEQASVDDIFVSCAAGNDGTDASSTMPASSRHCCTVGASDQNDSIWQDSNYGPAVDVYAPGVDINSTSNNGPDAWVRLTSCSVCYSFAGFQI